MDAYDKDILDRERQAVCDLRAKLEEVTKERDELKKKIPFDIGPGGLNGWVSHTEYYSMVGSLSRERDKLKAKLWEVTKERDDLSEDRIREQIKELNEWRQGKRTNMVGVGETINCLRRNLDAVTSSRDNWIILCRDIQSQLSKAVLDRETYKMNIQILIDSDNRLANTLRSDRDKWKDDTLRALDKLAKLSVMLEAEDDHA